MLFAEARGETPGEGDGYRRHPGRHDHLAVLDSDQVGTQEKGEPMGQRLGGPLVSRPDQTK